MLKHLIYYFFVFGFACTSAKPESLTLAPANPEYVGDGIVFISLKFTKEGESVAVSYVETLRSSGVLKTSNEYKRTSESKYLIQLQDEKGRALVDCYIEDPLAEHKDVFSEEGKIEKGIVNYDEKIISLRVRKVSKEIAKVSVYEVIVCNQPKHIITLNCK
ncbi:MAG: hypothetical protein NT150_15725 [Bacteroidetes bacterium]|nr:hypothetical protein [Bacteroidota bacterium]